jgi:general secretion pathway protein C
MPDMSRLQTWLSKPAHAPLLVSLVLAALIVVEVTRASRLLLVDNPPRAAESARKIYPDIRERPEIDLSAIVGAHLFGVAAEDASMRDPGQAPATTADLVLAGTIATKNPRNGIAIIGGAGASQVYSVGDAVGDVHLNSVYLDHVILDRGGRLEKLALPRPLPTDGSAVRQPAQPARIGVAGAQTGHEDSRSLGGVMRIGASMNNEAGKLRGFRVYPGGNRAAFNATGLRGGDLVIGVNGTSVQDQDQQLAQDIFATLKSSATATLTIERFGQTRDVSVDLTQVPADAGTETPASRATTMQ